MRVSFVRDRLDYIPSHDTLLWHFIQLTMIYDNTVSDYRDRMHFMATVIAGGPYDSGYFQETVSDFVDDYDKIRLLFKDKNEKKVDTSELDDLLGAL